MAEKKNKSRLKQFLTSPVRFAKNVYKIGKASSTRNSDGSIKKKGATKKLTNPNPKQKELDQKKKTIKKLKGANKELMQKKINQLEKYGKSKTWKNPVGAKGGGKPSSVDHSKSSNTGKKMSAIEKRNRERFGDAHVDKLKARHKAFKEARRKKKK